MIHTRANLVCNADDAVLVWKVDGGIADDIELDRSVPEAVLAKDLSCTKHGVAGGLVFVEDVAAEQKKVDLDLARITVMKMCHSRCEAVSKQSLASPAVSLHSGIPCVPRRSERFPQRSGKNLLREWDPSPDSLGDCPWRPEFAGCAHLVR